MTWLERIAAFWCFGAVLVTAGCCWMFRHNSDVEEELRRDVLAEIREHAWLN